MSTRGREGAKRKWSVAALAILSMGCAHPGALSSPAFASGLWDAHTHLSWAGASALDSLVSHGVVAVRDCGGDAIQLRAWRDSIRAGQRRGPRIYFSGPVLDGPKTNMRHRVLVTTPERAAWVVDSLAGLGVSFIKTHNAIPAAAFFAVIREAGRHHLKVAAHLPRGVPAWAAADSGVGSLEHAAESMLSSPLYAGLATDIDGAMAWWRSLAGDSMLRHLARTGVAVTPTLVAYQRFALGASTEEDRRGRLQVLDFLVELTGRMHRAGIPLLAGSDFAAPDSLLLPGVSLQLEIGLLERAGLSDEAAVAAGSTAVAKWLGVR